jgi:hypothetical protein
MRLLQQTRSRFGLFSGSTLKMIACLFMLIDHAGMILFPENPIWRWLGRLAFPLFAFFMAEGCRYSKKPLKRFLLVLAMGVGYLIFYKLYAGQIYPSVFLTFSVSIALCSFLDWLKSFVFIGNRKKLLWRLPAAAFSLAIVLCGAWRLFALLPFDYGFFGMLTPVLVHLFHFRNARSHSFLNALDAYPCRLIMLAVGLCLIAPLSPLGDMQWFALAAIPLLALYDGTAGDRRLKYAFYLFYPLHLVVLEGIYTLLFMLSYL